MKRWFRAAGAVAVPLLLTTTPASTAEPAAAADPASELRPGQVVSIAGLGEFGYSGDGAAARHARLATPVSIDLGPDGSLYLADEHTQRLRVVDPDGRIDTVAGPETDGGIFPGSQGPETVAVDPDGTVYVRARDQIMRLDPDGRPTVIAGDGAPDPLAGIRPGLGSSLAAGPDGTWYVASDDLVRYVDPDGDVTVVAGGGELGPDETEGRPATEARLHHPQLAVDPDGTLYLTQSSDLDDRGAVIWRMQADGTLDRVAGADLGPGYDGDGGPAVDARIERNRPRIDVGRDGNVYLTDGPGAHGHVRVVDTDGIIRTVGPAFPEMSDLAVSPDGDVYVAARDQVRMLVRSADPPEPVEPGPDPWAGERAGTVIAVAGTGEPPPADDRPGAGTPPADLATGPDGTLYYPIPAQDQVIAIDPQGTEAVVAGSGQRGLSGDGGPATEAELNLPSAVAISPDGTLYIADNGNDRVRAVQPDGTIDTVAGSRTLGEHDELDDPLGDGGPATAAVLGGPVGLALDGDGTLYIANRDLDRVRAVQPDGTIDTVAGGGDRGRSEADGAPATEALLQWPEAVAAGPDGEIYFVEDRGHAVRRVDSAGVLTTVAGDADETVPRRFAGDGGPAVGAPLNHPQGITAGPDGRVYIADTHHNRVRVVDPDGTITTVAGTGEREHTGDGGPAAEAGVPEPASVTIDPDGVLYLAGPTSDRIRRIDLDGTITTVAGTDEPAYAEGSDARAQPWAVAVTAAGASLVSGTPGADLQLSDPGASIRPLPPAAAGQLLTPAPAGGGYAVSSDRVYRVYPDGTSVVVAGGSEAHPGPSPETGRASATTVRMQPAAVVPAPDGGLYLADTGRDRIYLRSADGTLTTVVEVALDQQPRLAADHDGDIYLAGRNHVDRVAPDGTITRVAGAGDSQTSSPEHGDGGPATEAAVTPLGIAASPDGELYLSTPGGIRRIDRDGVITLVAAAADGDGDTFEHPAGLAFDPHGNLYVADPEGHRVWVLVRPADMAGAGVPVLPLVLAGAVLLALAAVGWYRREQLIRWWR